MGVSALGEVLQLVGAERRREPISQKSIQMGQPSPLSSPMAALVFGAMLPPVEPKDPAVHDIRYLQTPVPKSSYMHKLM